MVELSDSLKRPFNTPILAETILRFATAPDLKIQERGIYMLTQIR